MDKDNNFLQQHLKQGFVKLGIIFSQAFFCYYKVLLF